MRDDRAREEVAVTVVAPTEPGPSRLRLTVDDVTREGPFAPVRRALALHPPGRIAQRESARFTRERSLVRSQVRPLKRPANLAIYKWHVHRWSTRRRTFGRGS